MRIYTDGGCRGNGQPGAIGAASAVRMNKWRKWKSRTISLPSDPPPTNQRAEITAIILGLEVALERSRQLNHSPRLNVRIHSDSKYAIGCMTEWIYKWAGNGWINCIGNPVANQDLLKRASDLDDRLREMGRVKYVWIPREKNDIADGLCNKNMDEQ